MQDLGSWVSYVTTILIILFIIFFRGGPGTYIYSDYDTIK